MKDDDLQKWLDQEGDGKDDSEEKEEVKQEQQ